jgi:fucose permease
VVVFILLLFLVVESHVREPLLPVRLLRMRNFTTANVLGTIWAAGTFAGYVIAAFYLQRVLGYAPLQVGLAFLPAEMLVAAFSASLSAKIVMRFGIRGPLWIGLLLLASGLALFARAPVCGRYVVDVLPSMLILGLGAGVASTPLLLAAMHDVNSNETGMASGIINTSLMMGGALGIAVLMSLADLRTRELQQAGAVVVVALNGGYHVAFLIASLLTAIAAVLARLVLRRGAMAHTAITVSAVG